MLHRMIPRQFAWSFTQERKPSFIYDVSEGLVYVDRRWAAVFLIRLLHIWCVRWKQPDIKRSV